MGSVKGPAFLINPNFRLKTKHLSVSWHLVDAYILLCEASITMQDRYSYKSDIVAQYHDGTIDIVYHLGTDFNSKKTQKWLRELFRDLIMRVAKEILPARVRYWENLKNLHGTGVTVRRLRKNILGQCSHSNHITLQPFLVIFKQEWMDGVILHEMAHYKYKHHRKSFWDFLSSLIGEDSQLADAKNDIAISPYYNYYLYLTKK